MKASRIVVSSFLIIGMGMLSCTHDNRQKETRIEHALTLHRIADDYLEVRETLKSDTVINDGATIILINNSIREIYSYNMGKMEGSYFVLSERGSLSHFGRMHDDKREGLQYRFHASGIVRDIIQCRKGYVDSILLCADALGRTLDCGRLSNGNGRVTLYYPDGTIEAEGVYENGQRKGKWLFSSANGAISNIVDYDALSKDLSDVNRNAFPYGFY